jgi:hypothetical protein
LCFFTKNSENFWIFFRCNFNQFCNFWGHYLAKILTLQIWKKKNIDFYCTYIPFYLSIYIPTYDGCSTLLCRIFIYLKKWGSAIFKFNFSEFQ